MKNLQLPQSRAFPEAHLSLRKEHLLTEITRDHATRPRWRPLLLRAGIAGGIAIVALAVLSVVNVFGGSGPGVVEKASAALAHSESAILHVKVFSTVSDASGKTFTSTKESWASTSPQYLEREIVTETEKERPWSKR